MDAKTPSSDTLAPERIFGYEILGLLGYGAASTIYAASHPDTRQICALKHVVCKTDKDARFVEQLRTEYEVGRKVNHPGLRRSLDLQVKSTWLKKPTEAVLLMELFDGVPLDQQLPPTMLHVAQVFMQTAAALTSLHHGGYLHCDLKPANILVSGDGAAKVIDLGQACPVGTKKPRIQGTPDFIAPEQVRCEPCTVRTDVFNFGATLYWCLCGQKLPTLFTVGKSDNSFLVDAQIKSPRDVNPHVPENLSNLVMECTRSRPEKRPADLLEVGQRLEVVCFALEKHGVAVGA